MFLWKKGLRPLQVILTLLISTFPLLAVTAEADFQTCRTDKDCVTGKYPVCRDLKMPGTAAAKICAPAAMMGVRQKTSINENIQKQEIEHYLRYLLPRSSYLQAETVKEMTAVFKRERTRPTASFDVFKTNVFKAYDTIAGLDDMQREVLARYMQRKMATDLQRQLIIATDIIRNPTLDENAESAIKGIEQKIKQQELRENKYISDMSLYCVHSKKLASLQMKRAELVYARDKSVIARSNLTPSESANEKAMARYSYENNQSLARMQQDMACGNKPGMPGMITPPIHRPVVEKDIDFDIYSAGTSNSLLLSHVYGLPPVQTEEWPRLDAIGKSAQRDRQEQSSNSKPARLPMYDESREDEALKARKIFSDKTQEREKAYRARLLSVAQARMAEEAPLIAEKKALRRKIEKNELEVEKMPKPEHLNLMGWQREKLKILGEMNSPLHKRLEEIKKQLKKIQIRYEALASGVTKEYMRALEALKQEYNARIEQIARDIKSSHDDPITKNNPSGLPEYNELKGYGINNEFDFFGIVENEPLRWLLHRVATDLVDGAINHIFQNKMNSPVSYDMAIHLATLKDIKDEHAEACWGVQILLKVVKPLDVTEFISKSGGTSLSEAAYMFVNIPRYKQPATKCAD